MDTFPAVVLGGGAAGMVAAIRAARRGLRVAIVEKTARLGRKILVTGGGKCNLSNDVLTTDAFNPEARGLAAAVFGRYGRERIAEFFHEIGLLTVCREEGRVFPLTGQASSVVAALELEITRLGVAVELRFDAVAVAAESPGFLLKAADGRTMRASRLVLAGGGRSYPALGADGSAHRLAAMLGHAVVEPVPSAVPVTAKDPLCHFLQGQRIAARVRAFAGGTPVAEATGELLFTQYGLSGTAILDVSEAVSIAVNRERREDVSLSIDMLPSMKRERLKTELRRRLDRGMPPGAVLTGILPEKFVRRLAPADGEDASLDALCTAVKERRFAVRGTRGWNEAEFTAGGVETAEVSPETLESRLRSGLHLAGEVLNVQGKRGGYNLAWAWASGMAVGDAL